MNTEDEIDQVLHTPENLSILNTSKWGHTQAVTVETKAALLQHLILEELSSFTGIRAFGNGLEQLGLLTLIKTYPTLMKPLFTYQEQAPLTAGHFWEP